MAGAGRSRRAWGWHPLADSWAARIVTATGVRPGELVLDIGAGHGALTRHLVAAGARVLAVEPHAGRAERLRASFADQAVTVLPIEAGAVRWPARPFRVVASPPFSIASELVTQLLSHPGGLVAADLVLQRAAVRSFVDGRGPAHWHRRWQLVAGRSVPRQAFRRPPTVDSRVLMIRRRR